MNFNQLKFLYMRLNHNLYRDQQMTEQESLFKCVSQLFQRSEIVSIKCKILSTPFFSYFGNIIEFKS